MHLVQIGGDESAESSDVISRFEQVWHHPGHDAGSAAEVLQMRLRMLAFAVGRVEEQRRRWPCASKWPFLAAARSGIGLVRYRRSARPHRIHLIRGQDAPAKTPRGRAGIRMMAAHSFSDPS